MALIVEDGTSKTDSESYASVADADAYFTGRTGSSTWAATTSTTALKEQALRDATDYIEETYNARFRGRKSDEDQALSFPRYHLVDYDGYAIDSDEIPTKLKRATMELAVRALGQDLQPDLDSPGEIAEEESTVGSLSKRTKYVGGKGNLKSYRVVRMLLREFVFGNTTERS